MLDFGHTIVDFVLNEEALLAAYEEARGLLAEYLTTEAPGACPGRPDLLWHWAAH